MSSVGIGAVFVAMGSILGVGGGVGLVKSKEAANWPVAQGKILNTSVSKSICRDNDRVGSRSGYKPHVLYEYHVDGQRYEGSQIRIMHAYKLHQNPEAARRVIADFHENSAVPVFYNPKDPSVAILKQGGASLFIPMIAISSLFIVMGGVLIAGLI